MTNKKKDSKYEEAEAASASDVLVSARLAKHLESKDGNFLAVIEIFDVTGARRTIVMPRNEANRNQLLFAQLEDAGLPFMSKIEQAKILDQVRAARYDKDLQLTRRTGWHGRRFLRPDGRVLGAKGELLLHTDDRCRSDDAVGGTLEGWIEGVATPMGHSSYGIFALCYSFAAPLLIKTAIQSGIFHFFGPAGNGKTTVGLGALSVHAKADKGTFVNWDATAKALEERAVSFNCALLPLDEIALLGGSDEEIAKKAEKISFTIASDTGRGRSFIFSKDGDAKWSILGYSTGERAITCYFRAGNRARLDGDVRRLIDIPTKVTTDKGVFDRAPQDVSSADIARLIEESAALHYGVAIEHFISSFLSEEDRHTRSLKRWMVQFREDAIVPTAPWERAFSERFALAYAAARLARRFNILPWRKDLLLEVVASHYSAARAIAPVLNSNFPALTQKVFERLGASDSIIWADETKEHGEDALSAAEGFLRGTDDDQLIYAIRPSALREWVGDDVDLAAFGQYLRTTGVLLTEDRNIPTKQMMIAGLAAKERYYCFIQHELLNFDWLGLSRRRRG